MAWWSRIRRTLIDSDRIPENPAELLSAALGSTEPTYVAICGSQRLEGKTEFVVQGASGRQFLMTIEITDIYSYRYFIRRFRFPLAKQSQLLHSYVSRVRRLVGIQDFVKPLFLTLEPPNCLNSSRKIQKQIMDRKLVHKRRYPLLLHGCTYSPRRRHLP